MKRTVALLAAALLAAGFAPTTAQAASCVGQRARSIFGIVQSAQGKTITLRTNAPTGDVTVYLPDNDLNYVAGATLRPGVYAGVWGCLPHGDRDFIAEKVTLAPSAEAYPDEDRFNEPQRTIEGRIDQVSQGRILVRGTARRDTWVITNQTFAVGQTVRVTGYFEDEGRAFVAKSVAVVR